MNRTITTDFWLDTKVEEMSSTAKYLLLYLLTNPKTNLAGCYEVTYRRASNDTGLTAKQVESAMAELCEANVVGYCVETNECLIFHWDRYNWTSSPKLDKPLVESISTVKHPPFMAWLINKYENERGKEFPVKPDTLFGFSDTVSEKNENLRYDSISISITNPKEDPKGVGGVGEGGGPKVPPETHEIISYLNSVLGTSYRVTGKKTASLIRSRLSEGFTVADFKSVIDKKAAAWRGDPKMAKYLRPETLFGTKFEGYLNEIQAKPKSFEEVASERYSEYIR